MGNPFPLCPPMPVTQELLGCDIKYWEMVISGAQLCDLGLSQGRGHVARMKLQEESKQQREEIKIRLKQEKGK